MDHDLSGVAFRVTGMRAAIRGNRMANGAELLRPCSFAELRALRGCDVPGIGVVLDVGAPKIDVLPVGQVINLVASAAPSGIDADLRSIVGESEAGVAALSAIRPRMQAIRAAISAARGAGVEDAHVEASARAAIRAILREHCPEAAITPIVWRAYTILRDGGKLCPRTWR